MPERRITEPISRAAVALPAGSTIRFRVRHEDGRTGSSWSVKTSAKNSDVVLSHREGGRWVHATFHSGEWHYAISAQGQALKPGVPPYPLRLPGREPPAGGFIRAARISVAVNELRQGWVEQAGNRRGVVEIPPVQGYDAVAVELLLLAPDVADVLDSFFTVGRIARGSEAGSVLVVAHSMSLAEPVRVRFASEISQALQGMRDAGWDGSATRFVIPGYDPVEGYLGQVEFAADS